MRKQSSPSVYFKRHFMKASIFDETGRKIYSVSGSPKKCIKEIVFFTKSGLQIIDIDDILESFDWLDLESVMNKRRRKGNAKQ